MGLIKYALLVSITRTVDFISNVQAIVQVNENMSCGANLKLPKELLLTLMTSLLLEQVS